MILYNNLSEFFLVCYSCYGYGHFAKDCKEIHFYDKISNIKHKKININKNSRIFVVRVRRRTYHALNEISEVRCASSALDTKPEIRKLEKKRTLKSQMNNTIKLREALERQKSLNVLKESNLSLQKKKTNFQRSNRKNIGLSK